MQEGEVRLADCDVVGGGIGVQLLVPLLQEALVNALMKIRGIVNGGEK